MVSKVIALICVAFLIVNSVFAQGKVNSLSRQEEKAGWILLFDGKSLNGWTAVNSESPPSSGWHVNDGVLVAKPEGTAHGNDIISKDQYSDFELSIDFKLAPGGNSGIKYLFTKYEEGGWLGLEYQILDDVKHPDAKNGSNGNRLQASLYDMLPLDKKVKNIVGEWNNARIQVKGSKVIHYLNGVKVLSFNRSSTKYKNAWKSSKYKNSRPLFGHVNKGHILLQDHGDEVSFKNIKIRIL